MFIARSCCGISSIADAATAELRALRDGLLLAWQVGCNILIVNSDCMDVIETMRNGGNSMGGAAAIYEECSFLARNFARVKFFHSPRESNIVAHMLACKAEGPESIVWHKDPPDFTFIVASLPNDVSLFSNQ
jgi:hypothetical protein